MIKVKLNFSFVLVLLFIAAKGVTAFGFSPNEQKPNGRIKEIKEEEWLAPESNQYSVKDTNLVLTERFLLDKSVLQRYDSNANLVFEQKSYVVNRKSNKTLDSVWYNYYQQNNLIAQSIYVQKDRVDSIFNKYKKRTGLLENAISYDKKNNVTNRIMYTYQRGLLFNKRVFKDNLTMQSFARYKYKDTLLTEVWEYNNGMVLQQVRRFSAKPDEITEGYINQSQAISDANGALQKGISTVLDNNGFVVEISTLNSEREVEEYWRYNRDANGNVLEEKILSRMTQVDYRYSYVFDSYGNWTRKLVFKNDVLYSVINRSFEYY